MSKERLENMELRKLKISFVKSGSGSLNTRLGVPISWIKELGISQENKEVLVYKINGKIIISKNYLEWNIEEVSEIAKIEIVKILSKRSYIELKEIYKIYDEIIDCYKFQNEEDRKIKYHNLYAKVQEFLEKKYSLVLDDEEEYFFDKKYDFRKVNELKEFFKILK